LWVFGFKGERHKPQQVTAARLTWLEWDQGCSRLAGESPLLQDSNALRVLAKQEDLGAPESPSAFFQLTATS